MGLPQIVLTSESECRWIGLAKSSGFDVELIEQEKGEYKSAVVYSLSKSNQVVRIIECRNEERHEFFIAISPGKGASSDLFEELRDVLQEHGVTRTRVR